MRSRTIEHIGIAADDTEALAAWYSRMLGFSEFFRTGREKPAIFLEDASGTRIEIFARGPGDRKPGFDDRTGMHIAIAVDDFDEAVDDLARRGVVFIAEARDVFAGGKARFFADPEGNRLHIVYRPRSPW